MITKNINQNFNFQLEKIFKKDFKIEKKYDIKEENGLQNFSGFLYWNDIEFNFYESESLLLSIEFEKINYEIFPNQNSYNFIEDQKKLLSLKKIHKIIPDNFLNSLICFENYFKNEPYCDIGIKLDIEFQKNKDPIFIIEIYFMDNDIDLTIKTENNKILIDSIYNGKFYMNDLEIKNPEVDILNLINESFNININHFKLGEDIIFSNILKEIKDNLKIIEIERY